MRSTTDTPVAETTNQMAHDTLVSRTADLSITIQTRDGYKKPIKYRATRRSDGVVVEHPRYSPATSTPPRPKTAPVALESTATFPGVGRYDAIIKGLDTDLAAKGSSWGATKSACVRARTDNSEWNGHNRLIDSTGKEFKKADTTGPSGEVMLKRYLATDGPWSTYELRDS
jgi:hypothetical protein